VGKAAFDVGRGKRGIYSRIASRTEASAKCKRKQVDYEKGNVGLGSSRGGTQHDNESDDRSNSPGSRGKRSCRNHESRVSNGGNDKGCGWRADTHMDN
jgi:hypothetical protein